MSSLFSEAFSEMWRNRERSCDGRRWWCRAPSPSTPPDGPGESFLPINGFTDDKLLKLDFLNDKLLYLYFLIRSGHCLICKEQQLCRQQTPPCRWISKTVCSLFCGIYLLCRRLTLPSYTSKLPASRICWSCSMLAKPVSTTQETWRLLPMLGLLKTSLRAAATIMST